MTTIDSVKTHLRNHKGKYLFGAGIAVGVVVTVVVTRRISAAKTISIPAEALVPAVEPVSTYALGAPDSAILFAMKPSVAEQYNQAAEFIRNAPVVPMDGEQLKWLIDPPVDLSIVEKVEEAVHRHIQHFGPIAETLFSEKDPTPLFPVPVPPAAV